MEESVNKESEYPNENSEPSEDDIEHIQFNGAVENHSKEISSNEEDPEIEHINSNDSSENSKNEIDSRNAGKQNKSVSFVDTFDEDIDAPDSVASSSQVEDGLSRSIPQSFPFNCVKCKKGFQTDRRHQNHVKNCVGQKVSESSLPNKPMVAGSRKLIPGPSRKNIRFEQLKTNWSDLLGGRERCGKCGRNNYAEDDVEKHKRVCQGTLLNNSSRFICPHCTKPSRVFNTENAMRRHVSTNHAKEAMEDDWDYKHEEFGWKGMAIATKHLFR